MKHYTKEEIYQSLVAHEGVDIAFTDADRARVLANPYLKDRLAGLQHSGEVLRKIPTPTLPFSAFKRFALDGNRSEFETPYFLRRNKLLTYAVLTWLYGREEDLRELENIVFEICNEYSWAVPAHLGKTILTHLQDEGATIDLFGAETAEALSEMLTLVGDKLDPLVRRRVELHLEERTFSRVKEVFHWNAAGTSGNWVSVCGGCVGMAALYTIKDNERLADILAYIIEILHNYDRGFAPDGCCTEGVSYWRYGFGYFTVFADLLRRRTGGEIDLFDDLKMQRVAESFQKYFMTGVQTVVFADSNQGLRFTSLNTFLSKVYDTVKTPSLAYFNLTYPQGGCFRFALELRDFVWCSDRINEDASDLVGTGIFEDAQWYVASSENGIGFAAKAGHNAEFHNHNDVGSFHLYKNGEMLIADIGRGEYTADYFGKRRYEFFCNSSASHNVPVVNGAYQVKGREHAATDVVITESGMRADIARAYGDETLKSLVRDMRFDTKTGVVTIEDTCEFSTAPVAYSERFVTYREPTLGDGEITFRLSEQTVTLTYDGTALTPSVSSVQDKVHNGQDRTTYVVDLVPTALEEKMHFTFTIS